MSGTAYDLVTRRIEERVGKRPTSEKGSWLCPAHGDSSPSLSVSNGNGKVMLNCHAGCSTEAVLQSIDLTFADLFDEPKKAASEQRRRIVATYDYTDANGDLLFQVVRFDPKDFRQRRPDGTGGWEWSTRGIKPTLFRLPAVMRAIADGSTIFVVEGEKDVLALEAAGEVATCNAQGAEKWKPEHAAQLVGAAEVVIVADKDTAGRKHAAAVHATLAGKVDHLLVAQAKVGKDAADHLGAGLTTAELELVDPAEGPNDTDERAAPTEEAPPHTDVDGSHREPLPSQEPDPALTFGIAAAKKRQAVRGGDFILDQPAHPEPLWGDGHDVIWSEGEGLMLVGPQGTGKTTIAQQLVLARMGMRKEVIGYPVKPGEKRTLYIAADRPPQAQRSMARMVTEADRQRVNESLEIWRGPLPFDLVKHPEGLALLCQEFNADTVVIDSLKDVAAKLTSDETGQAVNRAVQVALLDGVQVLELHHQRKAQADNKRPKSISDVYGSTWLTSGLGSVVLLWGEPGDAIIELEHLKQPVDSIGPLTLLHDHDSGDTTVQGRVDLLDVVRAEKKATAQMAARKVLDKDKPTKNEVERIRRRLDRLVATGMLNRSDPKMGGTTGTLPVFYTLAERRREDPRELLA